METLSSIPVNQEDIFKILAFDKDQLYSFLGLWVLGTDTSPTKTLFSDEFEAVQKRGPIHLEFQNSGQGGRNWLKDNFSSIRPYVEKTLCEEINFCKDKKSILKYLTMVLAALVPVIVTFLSINAAKVVTVGVLLVKYNGRVLCACSELSSGRI